MRLFNVSTGMAVKSGSSKTAGGVLCLAFEPAGAELWAGDSKVGSLYLVALCDITACMLCIAGINFLLCFGQNHLEASKNQTVSGVYWQQVLS